MALTSARRPCPHRHLLLLLGGWVLAALTIGSPSWAQTASETVKVRVGFPSLPLEIQVRPHPPAGTGTTWVDPDHQLVKDAMIASGAAGTDWTVASGGPLWIASEAGMMSYPSRNSNNQNSFENPTTGAPAGPAGPTVPTPPADRVLSMDEFAAKRPDIFTLIPQWNPDITDRTNILKEWVKITTDRGDDYKMAVRILKELGQ